MSFSQFPVTLGRGSLQPLGFSGGNPKVSGNRNSDAVAVVRVRALPYLGAGTVGIVFGLAIRN